MTGANKLDEANQSGPPGIVRVDRRVRAHPERAGFEKRFPGCAKDRDESGTDYCCDECCAGWEAWKSARPARAAVGRLVNLSAKLLHPDTLRKLWRLEEESGRTLGRRALSDALADADENLKLLAIELRRAVETL